MGAERSVLLFGSSLYTHSRSDESESVAGLLQKRLGEVMPQYLWKCRGRRLYMTDQAIPRAMDYVAEDRPDVVVFDLPTYQFVHRAALIRLQRRWPLVYGAFKRAMEGLKALGGSSMDGATGPRGAVFRVPRDLARRVIGSDVEQPVEMSLALAYELLDALIRLEDVLLICGLPKFYWSEPDPEWCRARIRTAEAGLRGYCRSHHIPVFDLASSLDAAGESIGVAPDGIHVDTNTSRFEADLIAGAIREALG